MTGTRRALSAAVLVVVLAVLSLLRPVDHDESQYVAAAQLVAGGLLPFRDFAYFQTPLQPLLLAPLAAIAGEWTWPALRLANAGLGALAVLLVHAAARAAGARGRTAGLAAAALAASDVFLFATGTARNDALPAALLAGALLLAVQAERDRATRIGAVTAGLLLAAAAAAKISYALPALGYGGWALAHRRHRPAWVAAGALGPALLVGWFWALAPDAFVFEVLEFPARAPAQFYADRPWKLSLMAKAVDAAKFLALGLALPALVLVAAAWWRDRRWGVVDVLLAAGLVAALLPEPTWRQYLLPVLPPLFVRAALAWEARGPRRRIVALPFALAGLVPSMLAVAGNNGMEAAMRDGWAIRRALVDASVTGAVATLSPQYLPAARATPDARFAAGPFHFRTRHLIDPAREGRLRLVSAPRLDGATLPQAVLVGGEAAAPGGSRALDVLLARRARQAGYRSIAVAGTGFTLLVRPPPGRSPIVHRRP